MTSISEQIRSRQDFSYNTKVFYKKHTWRIAFYQPEWREENKIKIQDAWYRNRKICEYLREKEKPSWKTRADRRFYVYLTRPDRIPEIIDQWGHSLLETSGPLNSKHQDIMLNDLQVVTRKKLWYSKYRYKISSRRFGEKEQEIFEDMQNFCVDSFEAGTFKLNDTFRKTSKTYQKRIIRNSTYGSTASGIPGFQRNLFNGYRSAMPYTATGSIYLINHDDMVTLHLVYKQYITNSQKVITFDELE